MTGTSACKTPEGKAAFLAAYDAVMELWLVPYEEFEIPTRFGTTHVVASGPKDAPPLVLLHGQCGTLTMWASNVGDLSKEYRVYAIDVMGQPSKSIPDPGETIRDTADFVTWLSATLDGLNLDRISLVGASYGGWLGLNFAMAAPQRVRKLALLSPAASFQPFAKEFNLRAMLMFLIPARRMVSSYVGWLGVKEMPGDDIARLVVDLIYLGLKHFRMPPETARVMPTLFSDDELRALRIPVLLLIGENEVMVDPVEALARARALIPQFEGDLLPHSSHDMCSSQSLIVDARVLSFLNENRSNGSDVWRLS